MPNYCNNTLILTHDDPAMIERAAAAFENRRLLDEFVPVPMELKETMAGAYGDGYKRELHEFTQQLNRKYFGHANWYDFCVQEWGTKWDVGGDDCLLRRADANTIEVSFESAWSPPVDAYAKLIAMGFEIKAYYDEPGMAFCGKWEGSKDDFVDDYFDYSNESAETVREVIGEELDDFWGISENMAEH